MFDRRAVAAGVTLIGGALFCLAGLLLAKRHPIAATVIGFIAGIFLVEGWIGLAI